MKFNSAWFKKHQRALLVLLNLPIIGQLLRRAMWIHEPWLPLVRITPSAAHYWLGGGNVRAEFSAGHDHAEGLRDSFYPLWSIIHWWDMQVANQWLPAANLGFDTLDEPATSDFGYIGGNNATYGPARTTAEASSTSTLNAIGQQHSTTYFIRRAFLRFDTSSLDSEDTLSSAIFRATVSSKGAASDTLLLGNYVWTPPVSTDTTVYNAARTTTAGESATWSTIASLVVDTPKDSATLDLDWINDAGFTSLVIVSSNDVAGTSGGAAYDASATIRTPSDATTAYRPRLIINYSSSSGWWYFF